MTKAQRQGLFLGIAIVAFGGAGYGFLRDRGGAGMPRTVNTCGVCLACKHEAKVAHSHDEQAPHKCPSCGQQSFYPRFLCVECQTRFVPELVRPDLAGPLRVPGPKGCPHCFSGSVTPYIADDPDNQPARDAPLPKWP